MAKGKKDKSAKARKKTVTKKKSSPNESAVELASKYPWPTEYGDHFETPAVAYAEVSYALRAMAKALETPPRRLRVLDPYYCAGATTERLAAVGFPRVRNVKEDFYASRAYERSDFDSFDVLCTNPPFSGDHKERIVRFARASGKPWALLLPAYCAEKSYFRASDFFALKPSSNYEFDHPHGAGDDKTPFQALWFVSDLPGLRDLVEHELSSSSHSHKKPLLCRDLAALVAARAVRGTSRPNPRTRRKRLLKRRASSS